MIRAGLITPSLYWGGAERWMHDLAAFSRPAVEWIGCAVTHPTWTDDTMRAAIGRLMPVWGHGRRAVQHVARGADVMIAWGTDRLAQLVAGYSRPVVYVTHGSGVFDRRMASTAVAGATHLAAVSRAAAGVFRGLADPEAVTVLHNGIDPTRCATTRPRAEVRAEFGLAPGEFAVGYVGRLAPEKNPAAIAAAVALLPERFRGVWIGDGYDQENQRRAIRRALGARAIFKPRVEAVGDYLQALDLFALVSPAEGFSLAMLEAMHAGVPVVTTPVGAVPELRERHGRLWEEVPVGCPADELAAAIARVERMGEADLRERTEAARLAVEEHYLAGHMAARWVEFLRRVAHG